MRNVIGITLLVLALMTSARADTISAQWRVSTPPDMAHSLQFSADGTRILLGSQHAASVIETSSGKVLHSLAPGLDEQWFERLAFTEHSDFVDIFYSGFHPPSFARRSLLNGAESHLIALEGSGMSHYAGNPQANVHVTARYSSKLQRIDVQTGQILPFKTDSFSPAAAVAADGSILATGTEGIFQFSAAGEEMRSWPVGDIWSASLLRLSDTEDRLAIGPVQTDQAEAIRVLSLTDGQFQDFPLPQAPQRYLAEVAFDENGVLVALVDYSNDTSKQLILLHLSTDGSQERMTLDLGDRGVIAAFDPAAKHLAVALSDGTLLLFPTAAPTAPQAPARAAPPRLVAAIGHPERVTDLAISPDGRLLASAGSRGAVWLYDARTNRAIRRFALQGNVKIAFAKDGGSLYAVDQDYLYRLSTRTGEQLGRWHGGSWTPSLLQVSDAPTTVPHLLCDFRGCQSLLETAGAWPKHLELGASRLAQVQVCGADLLILDTDNTLWRHPMRGAGQVLHQFADSAEITAMACSARALVLGTKDGRLLRIDHAGTLSEVQLGGRSISALARLPDGKILATVDGEGRVGAPDVPAQLHLLDPRNLHSLQAVPLPEDTGGRAAYVDHLVVSADGSHALMATQGSLGKQGRLIRWSLPELTASDGPRPALRPIQAAQFTADGEGLIVSLPTAWARWSLLDGKAAALRDQSFGKTALALPDRVLSQTGPRVTQNRSDRSRADLPWPTGQESSAYFSGDLLAASGRVALGVLGGTILWDGPDLTRTEYLPDKDLQGQSARGLSPDGALLVTQSGANLRLTKLTAPRSLTALWHTKLETHRAPIATLNRAGVGFDPTGQYVVMPVQSDKGGLQLNALVLDAKSGTEIQISQPALPVHVPALGDQPALRLLLELTGSDSAILRAPGMSAGTRIALAGASPYWAASDAEGRVLVLQGGLLWSRALGKTIRISASVIGETGVSFNPDASRMALVETDGTVSLWDTGTGDFLARLLMLKDGGWAVVDGEGRYDAADPGQVPGLSWVAQDDPFHPYPVEAFLLDYYEPKLLHRHLSAERFPPLPAPTERNRIVPQVRIANLHETPEGAQLTLHLQQGTRDGRLSGLGAVKLFRDRQLITLLELDAAQADQFDAEGQISLTLGPLTLPADRARVTFSAYAFNDDGVKSETVHQSLTRTAPSVISRRAYVLAVGVNRYDNPDWNLRYAASDAEATATLVAQGLRQSGAFETVHTVSFVSRLGAEAPPRLARRDMITAMLQMLAGRPLPPDLPPDLRRHLPDLPPVQPQDVVYLAFAGHGLATSDGRFHFFPQEFGNGQSGRRVHPEALTGTLDSDLLARLLMQIDARDMVLVIDACNAAASVEGDGFRPGPMGSRGLGQLAYDKAMRVLTASQAEAVALESDRLLHGALSYALLREGFEAQVADRAPKDGHTTLTELLNYATDRVPGLYQELRQGDFKPLGRSAVPLVKGGKRAKLAVQSPALFDFRPPQAQSIRLSPSE